MRYLAIDPGHTTGLAWFKDNGDLDDMAEFKLSHLNTFLDQEVTNQICMIIVEDYKLYPWKSMAQSWSRLETVRVIGAIDYRAHQCGIPVVYQDPAIKGIGYKWAGKTPAKNHADSHMLDAYVHGVYYLQKNGIRVPQQGKRD
jgi:hypothetical protein